MNFKKPKFWDLKKPSLLSHLLLPFTIFLQINNYLLKLKSKRKSKEVKTICIGNIYLGGTGKTPLTIKLFDILKDLKIKIATAKKYYLSQIEEQIMLKRKTNFITSKTREEIIEKSIQEKIDLIIFDDGLQDKNLNYDIQFVCFDSDTWIGNGRLIPSGPLRENLSSLKKYDAVFLKTINKNVDDIQQKIKSYNPKIEIFNTHYVIKNLDNFDLSKKYLFFCGIGNPNNFKNLLQTHKFNIIDEVIFPDHYNYKEKDINKIKSMAKKLNVKILTTEKDYNRLNDLYKKDIHFLEIKLSIKNEKDFTNFLEENL